MVPPLESSVGLRSQLVGEEQVLSGRKRFPLQATDVFMMAGKSLMFQPGMVELAAYGLDALLHGRGSHAVF